MKYKTSGFRKENSLNISPNHAIYLLVERGLFCRINPFGCSKPYTVYTINKFDPFEKSLKHRYTLTWRNLKAQQPSKTRK